MLYSPAEEGQIQKVLTAFADYLKLAKYVDVLYSEKIGYVFLMIEAPGPEVLDAQRIWTGAELCRRLMRDMAQSFLDQHPGVYETIQDIAPADQERILRELRKYTADIPEYRSLERGLFD